MVTIVAKTYLRMLPLSLFSGARSETENQVHLGCSMTFGSPSNLIYCITTSTDTYTDAHGLLRQQSKGWILFTFSESIDHGRRRKEAGPRGREEERLLGHRQPWQSEPKSYVASLPRRPFASLTLYHRLLPSRPWIYADKSARTSPPIFTLSFSPVSSHCFSFSLSGVSRFVALPHSPPNYCNIMFARTWPSS